MFNKKETKPYGLWPSQITPEMTGNLLEFSELTWSDNGCLLWKERSSNQSSLQRWNPNTGEITNLSGDIKIGGGLMYGGGSFAVSRDQIVFVEKGSNQLYLLTNQDPTPKKITNNLKKTSSPRISPFGNTLIFIHSSGEIDSLRVKDLSLDYPSQAIENKSDFYNYLRWHPGGTQLSWISWDHPNMPWDSSQLFLGKLNIQSSDSPALEKELIIAGGDGISVIQPEFSSNGQNLAYVSDQSGWWQIYLYNLETKQREQLTHSSADHGLPPWLQNQCTYGFSNDSNNLFFIRNQNGFASLWKLNLESRKESLIPLDEEYTWFESLAISPLSDQIALVASGGAKPPELITISPGGDCSVIKRSTSEILPQLLFSRPQAISWQNQEEEKIHGLYYQPHHPEFSNDGKPPLLIIIHSGPTRQKWAEFQPRSQYFTSRGYAVLEINYRGSTGYGRKYWECLKGKWGTLDVLDVYQGALELSERGWINPERIALLGSSSGGLTVLQLLVTYPGVFKAGISLYGVTNLLTLAKNPPKFERFYHDWLVDPSPGASNVFKERSPLFSADKIKDPVALFQGGKDPIVPQDQAEQIVKALEKNNIPYEYYLYPGEGHGFKKAENVQDFYIKTESFLRKYVLE